MTRVPWEGPDPAAPPVELSPAQQFVYCRTYARWIEDERRRERWPETVRRYFQFFWETFGDAVPLAVWRRAHRAVLGMRVLPSMRALWSAGPALRSNHIFAYNCCAMAFQDLRRPVELFYILMCGAGVGFSVERRYTDLMPQVRPFGGRVRAHVVEDSREGWARSLEVGLEAWFAGEDVEFDYSRIRRRGARLRTLGGRAPGPDPLIALHAFVRETVLAAQGRRLRPVEWLDIGNMIAEAVLVGGTRRASEITFSDLDDEELRHAKTLPFPRHRSMSNNSAVYEGRPDRAQFVKEWSALANSGTGERGIFNLEAVQTASPRRDPSPHFRTNPCGEIILRADTGQFCNLTEVVVRPADTPRDLEENAKMAVWLGAMQASLTDFPFVRPSYKEICDRERLLGVSLTGQLDNPALLHAEDLSRLKTVVLRECEQACRALGIGMSTAVTTGKPSGTVSQLVGCASGAHPRFAGHYVRRYRIADSDPLFHMMRDQGVPVSPEVGQGPHAATTWVLEFPVASPPGSITRAQMSALDQLQWYLKMQRYWCEHNQSMTVYMREHEWDAARDWVYEHFDDISGISFLPYDGGAYELAPYEEIDASRYRELLHRFPSIDYSQLSDYEHDDQTEGARELACAADACDLD